MNIRQIISISVLLCVCVTCPPTAHAAANEAAAPETAAPKRSVAFPVAAGNARGRESSIECVVNFGPPLPIAALAFSPDAKTLAVGGYQEALLWDLTDAKLAQRVGTGQISGMVHAVAFVDGGKALAVGDGAPYQSGAVKIFNIETGERTAAFDEPEGVVFCLAVSPDGEFLAAGDAGSLVHVWSLTARKLVKTIEGHNGWVLGAAFSGDGKRLATASADRTLRVWDVPAWGPTIWYDLPAKVHGAALSPDGATVVGVVGGPDEWALRIGRIDSDLQQAARRKPNARAVSTGTGMPLDIVWPARSANVFVSCSDHTVRAHQGASGRQLTTYSGHDDWVYCIASTPDGAKLASGSADGVIKLWSGAGGKPLATFIQLAPCTDEWLIITPQGYFATSSTEAVEWRTTTSSAPANELTTRYHKPDLVREALAATVSAPSASQRKGAAKNRRPNRPAKK